MVADTESELARTGIDKEIDGVPIKAFVSHVELESADFELTNVYREKLYHKPGAIDEKVPEQTVDIDGDRWTVISHRSGMILSCLTVERSVG
ncbi:hypothetical protein [Desulforhopalus singaporensis]|nr:hypothetical protein [Desulforhopalus singaporensis]